METLKLEAIFRSDMTKSHVKQLRKDGYVTGSVFGHNAEPISIELKLDDFAQQAKTAEAGIKSLIDMKIKGGPKKSDGMVILKEFYRDPMTRKVLDMQFQRINLKEKISVNVPIILIGEAAGAKEGGTLEQTLDELHISCLPTNIPPRIDINIENLTIGEHIRVADLALADDIDVVTEGETLVCTCVAPHMQAEEETTTEEEVAEEPVAEESAS